MKATLGVAAVLSLWLAACATSRPAAAPVPTEDSVAALLDAGQSAAQRSEHESDPRQREALVAQAKAAADRCLEQAPEVGACHYLEAIALGLTAREHPAHAGPLLTDMLASLARAESLDPGVDSAGPARVRAIVLTRAPGWPLGPGDPEAALTAARRATELVDSYPPNWLALAEAQARTGDLPASRASYARAIEIARALPASTDRDEWLAEADKGLRVAKARAASEPSTAN